MLKFANTEVMGWEHVIRGMRNPKNSWDKTDSYPAVDCGNCGRIEREGICRKEDRDCTGFYCFEVGPNDLDLMTRLRNAGTDHRKFMRMITVYLDITAPLYWWKEFDTYKVGTVANSCSTMHKIHANPFTMDDFSMDYFDFDEEIGIDVNEEFEHDVRTCEKLRQKYNQYMEKTKKTDFYTEKEIEHFQRIAKKVWRALIQKLPSSYNQKRTVMLNYEVLANMYHSRKNHKLEEWRAFCAWIETLPYSELITGKY